MCEALGGVPMKMLLPPACRRWPGYLEMGREHLTGILRAFEMAKKRMGYENLGHLVRHKLRPLDGCVRSESPGTSPRSP